MGNDIKKVDVADTKIQEGLPPSIPAVLPQPASVPVEVPANEVLVDDSNAAAILRNKIRTNEGAALASRANFFAKNSFLAKFDKVLDKVTPLIGNDEARGRLMTRDVEPFLKDVFKSEVLS